MKQIRRPINRRNLLLAGMLMTTCALPLWAYDIITPDSLRYLHDEEAGAAFLTYLALDSANADAYVGALSVPAEVILDDGRVIPVKGVTPVACAWCDQLESVRLSEGIEQVGYSAFSDCPALTEVTLPASLNRLGDFCFSRDLHLGSIDLPAGVSRVGDGAFGFCYDLAQVSLAEGLVRIAPHAFYQCSSLSQIDLPATVGQLGQYAFAYCTSLTQVTVHTPPVAITEDVFEGVDLSQCTLIVPHNLVEVYGRTPVWQDFQIVGNENEEGLDEVLSDEQELMQLYVLGGVLHVRVLADAPVLVYDMQGHRVAVCASGSGDNALQLTNGRNYIVRCGRISRKIQL